MTSKPIDQSVYQALPLPKEGDVLILEYKRGDRLARAEKVYRDGKWVVIWASSGVWEGKNDRQ